MQRLPTIACLLGAALGAAAQAEPQPRALCPGEARSEGLPAPEHVEDDARAADLLRCIVRGRDEPARALLGAGVRSRWAPAYAVAAGRTELLREILTAAGDPNATGPYGDQPVLTLAAARGQRDAVSVLLASGADPDRSGDSEFSGGSALAAAARAGHVEIARMLLAAGADVDLRESYHGETALWQLACRQRDTPRRDELIALLLEHGADPDASDSGAMDGWPHSGRSPLSCAIAEGNRSLTRTLLAAGADPNALVQGGVRTLELAREHGSEEIVRLLAAHGATAERPGPSTAEVYAALDESGFDRASSFYLLGAPRSDPLRRGEPFASLYRDRKLVPYLEKDLDGDGSPELALIVQRPGERPAELVLAVLGRGPSGWRVLHRRDSLEGNPVASAALEARPNAIAVHVFEARYQCDDEQPIQYELAWDPARRSVVASVRSPHLHPFERDWDCGE